MMGSMEDLMSYEDFSNNRMKRKENFKQKALSCIQYKIPRRYAIVLMMFLLHIIHMWKKQNLLQTKLHAVHSENSSILYPSIGHWTYQELDNLASAGLVSTIFGQMIGSLLIFHFSGYKFFLISQSISSFLHILMPITLQHHACTLVIVFIAQVVIVSPMNIAIIALWKNWAPPLERINLVLLSFYGHLLATSFSPFGDLLYKFFISNGSFYSAGVCGFLWCFLWFFAISEIPARDPLITQTELLYLENNIPLRDKEKVCIKDAPWKSIISSKPVLALCLLYVKLASSEIIISLQGRYLYHGNAKHLLIAIIISYIIFLPSSTILLNNLNKKYQGYITNIRKYFICGGLLLHGLVFLGFSSKSFAMQLIRFYLSYIIHSICLPAYISLPLDLCPQYVAIIAGITYTLYTLVTTVTLHFLHFLQHLTYDVLGYMCIFDSLVTFLTAVVFVFWGSTEEQQWPLNRIATPTTDEIV